ncbi:MAG: hypothetical protein JO041_07260 [Acidobacteria bacterium]|nr:hypothetical protein [Acidobacteriota bacterium]
MAEPLHDDRDLLALLKFELAYIEDGGYGRLVKTPWRPTILFRDSPTCLNFSRPDRPHPCSACGLMEFVPEEFRTDPFPCHHIPLNGSGECIDSLYDENARGAIEERIAAWLRSTIKKLEERQREKQKLG